MPTKLSATAAKKKAAVKQRPTPKKKQAKKAVKKKKSVTKKAPKKKVAITKKATKKSSPKKETAPKKSIPSRLKAANLKDKEPNFSYTITIDRCTVQQLDVNGTVISDPGASGKLYANTMGGVIYVILDATRQNATGSGTMQLKFLTTNKNLFEQPKPFEFKTGNVMGGISIATINL